MTREDYSAKLQVLVVIQTALTLPESADRTKLLEALWTLHAIQPLSGGGPGEE
jgi:hypothetical protein